MSQIRKSLDEEFALRKAVGESSKAVEEEKPQHATSHGSSGPGNGSSGGPNNSCGVVATFAMG